MKTKEEILSKETGLTIKSDIVLMQTEMIYVLKAMEEYAQQQVKALSINSVRLTLMLEALEKSLIQIKNDVDWSFTDCATWSKRQHEVTAKIELIKELLNNEA